MWGKDLWQCIVKCVENISIKTKIFLPDPFKISHKVPLESNLSTIQPSSLSGEREAAGFSRTLRLLRVSDLREAAGGRQGAGGQLQEDLPGSGHWQELGIHD